MGRILDITPRISPRLAVWPGDQPFSRAVALSLAEGANLDLSSVTTTVHLGAHADAPSHFLEGAPGIHAVDLTPYLGPCQVMAVDLPRGERILPEHLPDEVRAPRLLLRTGSFPDPERWNTDFNSLSPELVAFLHARGVLLVGLDTPSIDPFDSKSLEAHHALGACGMRNLEGLVLDGVAPGLYALVALPLSLEGADASPVRAVLLDESA